MIRDDLLYTAGLVDGEGSINFSRPFKDGYRIPCLSLGSTTYAFMQYLKKAFGGHITTRKPLKKRRKMWVWHIKGNAALSLLAILEPFMKEPKKKRRDKFLVKGYKVTVVKHRYTKKQAAVKKKFERKFFAL